MVASTAVVSGLLLVAVSIARLGGTDGYGAPGGNAPLLGPIADPGTRAGSILAVVLVAVPVALLLDQCVRLGSAAQRRRYQALTVAGATGGDLRRWGAVEACGPALAGAVLGVPVWLLLRLLLGDGLANSSHGTLVPTVTGPGLGALGVIGVVTAYGVFVGRRAAVRATAATRRERRPPRPWGPAVLVATFIALVVTFGVGVDLAAALRCGPWPPWCWPCWGSRPPLVAGLRLQRLCHPGTESAAMLRPAPDPCRSRRRGSRRGGRGCGGADPLRARGVSGRTRPGVTPTTPPTTSCPRWPRGILAVLALAVITLSLSLHSIRPLSNAAARCRRCCDRLSDGHAGGGQPRGVPAGDLPVTLVAAFVGALVTLLALARGWSRRSAVWWRWIVGGAVLLAVQLAGRVARPWLREAVAVGDLRTE